MKKLEDGTLFRRERPNRRLEKSSQNRNSSETGWEGRFRVYEEF